MAKNLQLQPNRQTPIEDTYLKNTDQLGVISFYSGELAANFDHQNDVFNTYIPRAVLKQDESDNTKPYTPQKILTEFATDKKVYAGSK